MEWLAHPPLVGGMGVCHPKSGFAISFLLFFLMSLYFGPYASRLCPLETFIQVNELSCRLLKFLLPLKFFDFLNSYWESLITS